MLETITHKIYKENCCFHLKTLLVFFVFLNSSNIVKSQSTDEVFQNTTETYHVENQQNNSWLYWEVSGGEILSANPSKTDSIVVKWNDIGTQQLSVYEKTDNNCTGATYSISIEVIEKNTEIELDIPNAFSPNNDGINDFFIIKSNDEIDDYKLIIMNRWGNQLYESHNLSDSWDGKHNGQNCSPATYFYIINYTSNGQRKIKKGFVHLF